MNIIIARYERAIKYRHILCPIIIAERKATGGDIDEPLDGDGVDELCLILKDIINYHEGNETYDPCEPEDTEKETTHLRQGYGSDQWKCEMCGVRCQVPNSEEDLPIDITHCPSCGRKIVSTVDD